MALDFLIWLCDGQKKDMQDALSGHRSFSVIIIIDLDLIVYKPCNII